MTNEQYAAITRELIAASPDGTVALPMEAIRTALMQDESLELQELVFNMAVPQPGGYMLDALDVAEVTTIGLPAAYVLGVHDRSLARPDAEFAARIGVDPIMVPGSHMAMLSQPAKLADTLVTLL